MIRVLAGIAISREKQQFLTNRLAGRMVQTGDVDLSIYLDKFERSAAEREAFINALTTNLTSFYREDHHFTELADRIAHSHRRTFRVWCAAASTGEEPYSLAMTLLDGFHDHARFELVATDVDSDALNRAARGVFAIERLEPVPQQLRARYFLRGTGKNAALARVRPELRRAVRFARVNLLEERWPLQGRFDAIFIRNVMIYFERPTQRKILERLRALMAPDGMVVTGHAETLVSSSDLFIPCGRSMYAPAPL